MKTHILNLLMLFSSVSAVSQTSFVWVEQTKSNKYGAVGYGIGADKSGNVYIAGNMTGVVNFGTSTSHVLSEIGYPLTDLFIWKLNTAGDLVWAKRIGDNNWDRLGNIKVDENGNVFATGQFGGTVDFDPGPGEYKLTSTGGEAFVVSLDSSGNFRWALQLKALGGDDKGMAVDTDPLGNVIVAGYFSDTTDFDPGPLAFPMISNGLWDAFILKLNSAGQFIWARSFGSTNYEEVLDLVVDKNGNVTVSGLFSKDLDFDAGPATYTLAGSHAGFVCQYDAAGHFNWAKKIPFFSSEGGSLALDDQNNLYVTGEFWGTANFDDGGQNYFATAIGNSDAFIVKLSNQGHFQWVEQLSGNDEQAGWDIAVDLDQNIHVTGITKSDTVLYSGGTQKILAGRAIIWNVRTDGTFLDLVSYGSGGYIHPYRIASHGAYIFTTGYFRESPDMNPGPASNLTSCYANCEAFALKLRKKITTVGFAENFSDVLNLSPNPTNGLLRISGLRAGELYQVALQDPGGRTLLQQQQICEHSSFDLMVENLPPGIYFLSIASQGGICVQKVVKL